MARLNREDALKRVDGDESLYLKMAGYFIRDYTDFPIRIRDLVTREDSQAYVLTHSLKNISASLGAEELASRALDLEVLLKRNEYSGAEKELKLLLETFTPVLEEIREIQEDDDTLLNRSEGGEGREDFSALLAELAQAMGSFSPEQVEIALAVTARSGKIIPDTFKKDIEKITALGRDFRYFDAEDLILDLQKRVLE